jgi:hypothetical protein
MLSASGSAELPFSEMAIKNRVDEELSIAVASAGQNLTVNRETFSEVRQRVAGVTREMQFQGLPQGASLTG